jgi:hypothetical protein
MDSDEEYVVDFSKRNAQNESSGVAAVIQSLIRGGELTDVTEIDPELLREALSRRLPAFPKREARLPH